MTAAAAAKSLQSCPTLCDPIDGSPPGSPAPGILQARTLEWVAISFSNAWKWKVKVKSLSRVRLLATPWTAAYQAPPPMDFPGKSTGVGCHCLLLHTYNCEKYKWEKQVIWKIFLWRTPRIWDTHYLISLVSFPLVEWSRFVNEDVFIVSHQGYGTIPGP